MPSTACRAPVARILLRCSVEALCQLLAERKGFEDFHRTAPAHDPAHDLEGPTGLKLDDQGAVCLLFQALRGMPETLSHIGGLRRTDFERYIMYLVIVDDPKGALPSVCDGLEHLRVSGETGRVGLEGPDALDAQHHEGLLDGAVGKQVEPTVVEAERIGMNPVAPGRCCPGGLVRDIADLGLQERRNEAGEDRVGLRCAIQFIVLRTRQERPPERTVGLEVLPQEGGDLFTGRVQMP